MTNRWRRSKPGRCRANAANIARSAQINRRRGFVRRSTATSCRSTSNSTSLDAEDRPSRTSHPPTRSRIKYTSRNHMSDDHALPADHCEHRRSRTQRTVLKPHSHNGHERRKRTLAAAVVAAVTTVCRRGSLRARRKMRYVPR